MAVQWVHHAAVPAEEAVVERHYWRYISHIPVKHFKMVRYYGFLSNRKQGEQLAESIRCRADGSAENAERS
ncbi:TPA: transposase [Enterobacter asburiae]